MDSNQKGAIAEAAIALHALRLGIGVLKPVAEHCRYDLAFDLASRIVRVQCKWAAVKNEIVYVQLAGYRVTPRGHVRSTYELGEIDLVAAYCAELDQVYAVPIELAAGKCAIHLRLESPRNGQRAAINWAEQYALGAVAQLEERRAGSAKATGSSPVSSTASPGSTTVGANQFRNLFGHYMERAEAGEEILVTRRGRPAARLTAAAVSGRV